MRRVSISAILTLALGLGGCGFQPLYGQREGKPAIQDQLAKVRIGEIATPSPEGMREFRDFRAEDSRSRQILRNYLLDALAPRGGAPTTDYVIDIRVIEPRTNLAIDRSDTTLRYGYTIYAYFTLRDRTGNVLVNSSAAASTSFEASNSEFATVSSQKDARDRVMETLSTDIRDQLAVFFLNRSQ